MYEPHIIIAKESLDKHEELLLNGNWQYPGRIEYKQDQEQISAEDGTVMEYLSHAYKKYKVFTVVGVKMILINPAMSSYNAAVRKKLDELGIEYGLDY